MAPQGALEKGVGPVEKGLTVECRDGVFLGFHNASCQQKLDFFNTPGPFAGSRRNGWLRGMVSRPGTVSSYRLRGKALLSLCLRLFKARSTLSGIRSNILFVNELRLLLGKKLIDTNYQMG